MTQRRAAARAVRKPVRVPGAAARTPRAPLVYELPVRLWHWISAAAIGVLAISGYLIASPPPSMPGEASAHYAMGYVRFAHFVAGYVLAIGFVGRLYWAFVGQRHARELFTLPVFSPGYWRSFIGMLRWYLFLSREPEHFEGHNPLARLSMVLGYSCMTLFMSATGFALYGEGSQAGSWAERWFGWVIALCGSSQTVHTLHHLGMWAMLIFVIVHVYAVLRDDVVGPESTLSSMISGRRATKD
jgi:Ni/Fe-hydrogenase 1 B-type cytochrome subunit